MNLLIHKSAGSIVINKIYKRTQKVTRGNKILLRVNGKRKKKNPPFHLGLYMNEHTAHEINKNDKISLKTKRMTTVTYILNISKEKRGQL